MTIHPARRARLYGALLLVAVFAAGAAGGFMLGRQPQEGLLITMTATSRIPRELTSLGLSDIQRDTIRRILGHGRPRVMAVMEAMEPRMRAAIDSTDREVQGVLTTEQRSALAAFRREHRRLIQRTVTADSGR